MSESIGFLGFGAMGSRMASRLVDSGTTVIGWSRTPGRMEAAPAVNVAASAIAVSASCNVVLGCLLDDQAVEQVYRPLLEGARPGQLFVEHGTFSPALARQLAERAARRGAHFVDAPVTGGPEGAATGNLVTMVGSDAEVFDRVRAAVAAYSRDVVRVGPSGRGLELKIVNQLLVSAHMAAAAEAAALLIALEIDAHTALRVLRGGWAASAMVAREIPRAIAGDYWNSGATVGGLVEVQRLVADTFAGAGIEPRLLPLVHNLFLDTVDQGHGGLDPAVLVKLYERVQA